MKICVLVKEVPDAAVEKRIDPSTGRMDRSGEKNLNPYDTHAIEAAMQIREGGAVEVEEIVAVTMGPEQRRARAAQGRLARRRPLGAPDRRRRWPAPTSPRPATRWRKALERESPDLVLLGQQSDDGECYTIGAVVAEHLKMPSLTQVIKMDVDAEALRCERQAEYGYDTVAGQAAGRDLGRRRDQRAALPVAEGDHGRQEEAARHASAPATSGSTRRMVGGDELARAVRSTSKAPPAKAAGEIIEDEDTNETVEKIVAWLDERKLI